MKSATLLEDSILPAVSFADAIVHNRLELHDTQLCHQAGLLRCLAAMGFKRRTAGDRADLGGAMGFFNMPTFEV